MYEQEGVFKVTLQILRGFESMLKNQICLIQMFMVMEIYNIDFFSQKTMLSCIAIVTLKNYDF